MGAKEMQHRLETQLERLRSDAAQTDSQAHAVSCVTGFMQGFFSIGFGLYFHSTDLLIICRWV
jgi:hypothetical protein